MKTMMRLSTMMIILMLIGLVSVNAQNEVAMPGGFVEHGLTAPETIDSVAVGAIMQYWAEPDAAIAGTNSTFAWTISPAVGSQTAGSPTNLATITMAGSPGTGTIQVVESSPASCGSGTTTSINVAVIALPTVTYPAAGGSGQVCATGNDGALTAAIASALNINWSSSVSGARSLNLRYDLTGPAGFANVTNHQVNITETGAGTGTFGVTETLTHYGTYTITLKDAADRISTKCNSMRNSVGITNATYTFVVYRTPTTGPIFHIPNM